jgi:hypothetical protein
MIVLAAEGRGGDEEGMNGLTDCYPYSLADYWPEFPVRLRRLRYPWAEQSSSELHRRDEGHSERMHRGERAGAGAKSRRGEQQGLFKEKKSLTPPSR